MSLSETRAIPLETSRWQHSPPPELNPEEDSLLRRIWKSIQDALAENSFVSMQPCCTVRDKSPEELPVPPFLTTLDNPQRLSQNYKTSPSLEVFPQENGKSFTLSGGAPQSSEDTPFQVPSFPLFSFDSNMIEDCKRLHITLNGQDLEPLLYPYKNESPRKVFEIVAQKVLSTFHKEDPARIHEVEKLSYFLNASVGIDLAVKANHCFSGVESPSKHTPKFFLENTSPYRLHVVILKKNITVSCNAIFAAKTFDRPEQVFLFLQAKVRHNVLENTAEYTFHPTLGLP